MTLIKRVKALEDKKIGEDPCPVVMISLVSCGGGDVIGLSGPDGMIERLQSETLDELENRTLSAWMAAGRLSGAPIIVQTYYSKGVIDS